MISQRERNNISGNLEEERYEISQLSIVNVSKKKDIRYHNDELQMKLEHRADICC